MSAVVLRADARCLPLPDASVDLIVTSPPYFGLRSYTDGGEHYAGQIGSEATPAEFVAALLDCTREWVRVLKPSGSLFVNLGDKYSGGQGPQTGARSPGLQSSKNGHGGGSKWITSPAKPPVPGFAPKSLLGLPWRYALGCIDQLGLILRAEIVWAKPNGLPESVTDRVRRSHEQVFHMTKQPRYFAAVDEIREDYQPSTLSRNLSGRKPHTPSGYTDVSRGVLRDSRPAGHEANPLGKLPGSVWTIPSAPLTVPPHLGVDHFAAFPPALVRPIVLGWSPAGICTRCGEGRRPVADRDRQPTQAVHNGHGFMSPNHGGRDSLPHRTLVAITGYACACPTPDAPTRPSTVLDPFGGTGTTALVASVYGRHAITADMSADYCRLAAWRTQDPAERARAMDVPKPPPIPDGQAALFT